jgi:hypothetical protein
VGRPIGDVDRVPAVLRGDCRSSCGHARIGRCVDSKRRYACVSQHHGPGNMGAASEQNYSAQEADLVDPVRSQYGRP